MRARVAIPLRLDDLEGGSFVSASRIAGLFSEARVRTILRKSTPDGSILQSVVVRNELEFLHPIRYSIEPVEVYLWVSRVGRTSATIRSEAWSEALDRERVRSAIAVTTIVVTDAQTGQTREISGAERVALEELSDGPPW